MIQENLAARDEFFAAVLRSDVSRIGTVASRTLVESLWVSLMS
jgi:hypothetical protein